MKKTLKATLMLIALVFTQTFTFAADAKIPAVYASQAPLSNLSCTQLLNTSWLWMMVFYVVVVLFIAFLSAQEKTSNTASH